jgi:L-iditol 2-dehydrogenase
MRAARLYGPHDVRLIEVNSPGPPADDEVVIEINAVGVCGSDLHTYEGHIGQFEDENGFTLGHEFGGTVVQVGANARDGEGKPLTVGTRVAVDPATSCWTCEFCEKGHPNLCENLEFYGLYPYHGSLTDQMVIKGRNCFPIPDSLSNAAAALLETLGVAIHAADLGKIRLMNDVSVFGCGPVGLLIVRMAVLAGARHVYVFDKFPWRIEKACDWGATRGWTLDDGDPGELIAEATDGRGVDVAFEAAWADESVDQATDSLRLGGRLVLVGIPGDDTLTLTHSVARRKGLTMMMVRRMKHTYPRAIDLVTSGRVDLDDLVSHRFGLEGTPEAFKLNIGYEPGLHKVVIDVNG